MNLKELLLEFAGENEQSLKLEDLLIGQVSDIRIEEDVCNGIRIAVLDESRVESITNRIKQLLDDNNYDSYSIVQEDNGNQIKLLIEVE